MDIADQNGLKQEAPTYITPEYMRQMEANLTPQQKERAFAIAEEAGWKRGDNPPMWVWQQIYLQAMAESY